MALVQAEVDNVYNCSELPPINFGLWRTERRAICVKESAAPTSVKRAAKRPRYSNRKILLSHIVHPTSKHNSHCQRRPPPIIPVCTLADTRQPKRQDHRDRKGKMVQCPAPPVIPKSVAECR